MYYIYVYRYFMYNNVCTVDCLVCTLSTLRVSYIARLLISNKAGPHSPNVFWCMDIYIQNTWQTTILMTECYKLEYTILCIPQMFFFFF